MAPASGHTAAELDGCVLGGLAVADVSGNMLPRRCICARSHPQALTLTWRAAGRCWRSSEVPLQPVGLRTLIIIKGNQPGEEGGGVF